MARLLVLLRVGWALTQPEAPTDRINTLKIVSFLFFLHQTLKLL